MKAWLAKNRRALLVSLVLSLIFIYPWLLKDQLGLEHDTLFHLSRLAGLKNALQRGDFLPRIYPEKNLHFGYAAPMFYNDFLLIPFAALYGAGMPLSRAFQLMIFCYTFCSAFTMYRLLASLCQRPGIVTLGTTAWVFANYRITDTYVRSSAGEIAALIFLPVLVQGIHELLTDQQKEAGRQLSAAFTGVLLAHNLSFLMDLFLLAVFLLINHRRLQNRHRRTVFFSLLRAFLLTCWFTLPMLEQLASQEFTVDYWITSSNLSYHALSWQNYLVNRTVFGLSGSDIAIEKQMVVNPGYFAMLAPLAWFALPKEQRRPQHFLKQCLILGYVCLLLPSRLVPWDLLVIFRPLQFPWRFMTLALVLLVLSACLVLDQLPFFSRRAAARVLSAVLVAEGIWHLAPVLDRTTVITSETTYDDLLEGRIIDPYYRQTYVAMETGYSGEYLPSGSPDFRTYGRTLKDADGLSMSWQLTCDGAKTSVTIPEDADSDWYVFPVSWYKGYQVYHDGEKVETFAGPDKMVSFVYDGAGTYTCVYAGTPLQTFSRLLSAGSALVLLILAVKNHKKTVSA